jgi:methylthioribose-1-phosphate isomerase
VDQRALPFEEVELELRTAEQVAEAIRTLAIRGAPLIGVAAAYGIALELARDPAPATLERACRLLAGARPTAVNLGWAVARVQAAAGGARPEDAGQVALAAAQAIHRQEEQASRAIACAGADLLGQPGVVLTHCNTGALAAPGRGTALAVVAELFDRGHLGSVIVTETRPLLQGARLTTYELSRLGIPHELVVDGAAPGLMAAGAIDAVVVGCDRVAANGDVANKVGTYSLALAANAAQLPFVVAGPVSTIDVDCPSGAEIVIEARAPEEVRQAGGALTAPPGTACRNPAFDVTPARLITALATDRGTAHPVDGASVAGLLA